MAEDSLVFSVVKNLILQGLEKFGRYYSVYRGFVVDNDDTKDPTNIGLQNKIQIRVPQIAGANIVGWAYPKGLYAGKGYGVQNLPAIGDTVYVSFEYGDPKFPLWEHGYYGKDEMPINADLNNPLNHWFMTPTGHKVEFDENNNRVRITHKDGTYITLQKGVIQLGGTTSLHPSVLGDNLVTSLQSLVTAIQAITVNTPAGLSTTPLNQITFTMIAKNLNSILSQINSLS